MVKVDAVAWAHLAESESRTESCSRAGAGEG